MIPPTNHVLTALFLILPALFFSNPAKATEQINPTIAKLAALPEAEIDIGKAALILAKDVFPDLDIQAYSVKIDQIVTAVRSLTQGSVDPDHRIRVLNTYLYLQWGMAYDFSDLYVQKLKNRYINGILDNKKGSCVSMPLLYLAVSQRLGYPVYPVSVPDHIFLRYVDFRLAQANIEATGGGGYSPDEKYIADLNISERGIEKGTYLKTLTYREFVGMLISQNGITWWRKNDVIKCIHYLKLALELNPRDAATHQSLGKACQDLARRVALERRSFPTPLQNPHFIVHHRESRRTERNLLHMAQKCFTEADSLGHVRLDFNEYVEKLKNGMK